MEALIVLRGSLASPAIIAICSAPPKEKPACTQGFGYTLYSVLESASVGNSSKRRCLPFRRRTDVSNSEKLEVRGLLRFLGYHDEETQDHYELTKSSAKLTRAILQMSFTMAMILTQLNVAWRLLTSVHGSGRTVRTINLHGEQIAKHH
jgi:hypothetical protein